MVKTYIKLKINKTLKPWGTDMKWFRNLFQRRPSREEQNAQNQADALKNENTQTCSRHLQAIHTLGTTRGKDKADLLVALRFIVSADRRRSGKIDFDYYRVYGSDYLLPAAGIIHKMTSAKDMEVKDAANLAFTSLLASFDRVASQHPEEYRKRVG